MVTAKTYAKLIRKYCSKPSGSPEPCAVCDKYKTIAHMHHVIPVSEMSKFLENHQVALDELVLRFPVYYVWLCPNHHALFHKFNGHHGNHMFGDARLELIEEIGWDEYKKMQPIFEVYEKAWGELFMEYIDINHPHYKYLEGEHGN